MSHGLLITLSCLHAVSDGIGLTYVYLQGILSGVPEDGDFSSSRVVPVLREACEQAGLSSDGAELLRLGENAIFGLAGAPVVVRIARSAGLAPRVERELC